MLKNIIIFVCGCALYSTAFAERSLVNFGTEVQNFDSVNDQQMKIDEVYYSYSLNKFADWSANRPEEVQLLNRFPGFIEQTTLNGSKTYTLTMFVGKGKFLMNRASSSFDFSKLLTLENLKAIDSSFEEHKQITVAETAPVVNPTKAGYTQNPEQPWCEGAVLCLQSRYDFGTLWAVAIGAYNISPLSSRVHDSFIEMQTESKILNKDSIPQEQYQALTNLSTPVEQVLVQTVFYANDYFEFAKILSIVQQSPSDPNATVITMVFGLALKDEMLNKARKFSTEDVDKVIVGESIMNGSSGPELGLPGYTQEILKAMAQVLEVQ
ncbi:MAG: hypothetical protein IT287_04545 [Bdellovibrionaceae bacterium]|nr:hypothetical protein [Pseudobdellovibrionaceae bacterium]